MPLCSDEICWGKIVSGNLPPRLSTTIYILYTVQMSSTDSLPNQNASICSGFFGALPAPSPSWFRLLGPARQQSTDLVGKPQKKTIPWWVGWGLPKKPSNNMICYNQLAIPNFFGICKLVRNDSNLCFFLDTILWGIIQILNPDLKPL